MAEKEKEATFAGLTFEEVKDLTAAGLPIDQIKELARAGFSAEQLLELAGNLPRGSGGLSKEDLLEVVKAGSDGKYHQNARHPGISAFSYPEGEVKRPKATLRRETYVNGHKEDAEQLTPAEIDAFNRITRNSTAREGTWVATIRRNGTTEQLHILLPTSLDARPTEPLPLILRELEAGPAAVDPASLAQRVAELEAQLAEKAVAV